MNTPFRLLPALSIIAALGCYGDKVFVEDGAGGDAPTSTSTTGGAAPTGGNGSGAGATGGDAPSGGGGEGPVGCSNPSECPVPASDCVEATCEAMTCGEANKPEGDVCADGFCDGEGACVECLDNDACTAPDTCDLKTHECVPPQCSNGNLDAGETDIDCGGTVCGPCQNNDDCLVASDCVSLYCGPGNVCLPCSTDNQCAATHYCLFMSCVPRLANGSACNGNNQCLNNACVQTSIGGICCNSACTGTCMSCAIGDTGVATGTCGPTLSTIDPENECPTQPCRTGFCSGNNGGCGISPVNSSCDDALFCNGSDVCTSTGTCSHSGDPCAEATPDANCQDSCNEAANNCTGNSVAGSPCQDNLFCNGSPDMCNGSGSCVASTNPCPGHNQPTSCNDSCNETNNNCTANDVAGTACDQDSDGTFGVCGTNGNCSND